MFRLVIVSGPNRGSSFTLVEGRNTIGRSQDSQIVLSSTKVSKLHCTVYATQDGVDFLDEGSTNGTFVNGALSRKQSLKPGDKLSVGEFVMELVRVGMPQRSQNTGMNSFSGMNPIMVQQTHGNLALSSQAQPTSAFQSSVPQEVEVPEDLPGKLKFVFEGKIMPIFYSYLMKTEYKVLASFLIGILVLVSVVGAVTPVLNVASKAIEHEARIRAVTIAREVADRFLPAVSAGNTSQIDLTVLENDDNIRLAAIVGLDLQIIAPQSRMNQILAGNKEASLAMLAAKQYRAGQEAPISVVTNDSIAIAIEPLKAIDVRQMKSQIAGMVVVSVDFSRNSLEQGGTGIAYAMALLIAGIAGFFIYLILMRITIKPFEVLNDDLDQVLRGELPKITHEFKIAELNNLWENINSAAVRGAKSSSSSLSLQESHVNWDHEVAAVRAMAEVSGSAFIAFDPNLNVVAMNPQLDEVMGLRMDTVGQNLQQIARDMAFTALVNDLKERVQSSPSRSALEETEFSGVLYQVVGMGVGPFGDSGLALIFKRKG